MGILSFREIVELGRLQTYISELKYVWGGWKKSEFFHNVAIKRSFELSGNMWMATRKKYRGKEERKILMEQVGWGEKDVKNSSTTFWAKKYIVFPLPGRSCFWTCRRRRPSQSWWSRFFFFLFPFHFQGGKSTSVFSPPPPILMSILLEKL